MPPRVLCYQVDRTGRSFIKGAHNQITSSRTQEFEPFLCSVYRDHRKVRHRGSEVVPSGSRPRYEVLHPGTSHRVNLAGLDRSRWPRPCRRQLFLSWWRRARDLLRRARRRGKSERRSESKSGIGAGCNGHTTHSMAPFLSRQLATVTIKLIRDAWDQSSTSTILYFFITFPRDLQLADVRPRREA